MKVPSLPSPAPVDGMTVERIDAAGRVIAAGGGPAMLDAGEALHRHFRSALGPDYRKHMGGMFGEGAALVQLMDDGEVRALAVWRAFHTTYCGYRLEIDDLVTDEMQRSKGYGRTLLTSSKPKRKPWAVTC